MIGRFLRGSALSFALLFSGLQAVSEETPPDGAPPIYASIEQCAPTLQYMGVHPYQLAMIALSVTAGNTIEITWVSKNGQKHCEIRPLPPFADPKPDSIIILPRLKVETGSPLIGAQFDLEPISMNFGTVNQEYVAIFAIVLVALDLAGYKFTIDQIEGVELSDLQIGAGWQESETTTLESDVNFEIGGPASYLDPIMLNGIRPLITDGPTWQNGSVKAGTVQGMIAEDWKKHSEFPDGYPGFPKPDEDFRTMIVLDIDLGVEPTRTDTDDPTGDTDVKSPDQVSASASKSDFIAVCQSNGVRDEACEALYQQMMSQFGATVVAYHVHLGFDRFDDAEALKSLIDEDTLKASRDLMDRATW